MPPEIIVAEVYTQTSSGWLPTVVPCHADTSVQLLGKQLQLHTGVCVIHPASSTIHYVPQIDVADQDLRTCVASPKGGCTMIQLTTMPACTLGELRPLLAPCGSVPGAVPMLLSCRRSAPVEETKEHAEALECAQLLATLADTARPTEPVPCAHRKGRRTERRAVKRPLPLPLHMREDVQCVAASPVSSLRSCDSDSDDVVWAPSQSERPVRRRRYTPAHLNAAARGKRAETGKRWSPEETDAFIAGVERHGVGNWQKVHDACSAIFGRRTTVDLKDKRRNLVKAVTTPGLIPRSVRLTAEQKERIQACIAAKGGGR